MDISDAHFEKILAGMAAGDITSSLGGYIQANEVLIEEVKEFDQADTLRKLAGLLLVPRLQYFSLRIEALINVVAHSARGNKKANGRILEKWLNEHVGASSVGMMEDPPEDVHVSAVNTEKGTFKILEGTWEGNDFFLQRIINMVNTIPKDADTDQILNSVHGLLALSDGMISAENIERYASERSEEYTNVRIDSDTGLRRRARASHFPIAELKRNGIDVNDLVPFICDLTDTDQFEQSDMLYSPLTSAPLILDDKSVSVAMPTAISAAIRTLCIRHMIARYGPDPFEGNLAHEYYRFFQTISLFGDMGAVEFRPAKNKSHYMAACSRKFDVGRYFGLVFIFDNSTHFMEDGWHSSYSGDDDVEDALSEVVTSIANQMSEKDDFVRGYVFVVPCGYGRAQVLGFNPPQINGLSYESISSFDLHMLSQSKGVSIQEVTKLIDQYEFFRSQGYKFMNPNGLLNLYAYWQASGKWLLPEEMGFGLQQGMLALPTDSQLEARIDNRRAWDEHSLYIPGEGFLTVRSKAVRPLFKEDQHLKVYAPMILIRQGRLLAATSAENLTVWVEMLEIESDRDLHYQLWDLCLNWTCRILPNLPQKALRKPLNLHLCIDTTELNTEIEEGPISAEAASKCLSYSWNKDRGNIDFTSQFLQAFRNEGNVAERVVIEHLISCLSDRLGLTISDQFHKELMRKIVWSDDARFFHAFSARDYLDYARALKERDAIVVEEEDSTFAKLGMAWSIIDPQEDYKIEGLDQCKAFMIPLTQSIWGRIRDTLTMFNKRSIIEVAMSNMLACHLEVKHWHSTSRSNYALHKDQDDVANVIMRNTNRLTPSAMGSRVLIEMANCVCPEDEGRECSESEFALLLAHVSLMFHYGNVSEAMRTGYIPPLIHVNNLGDVLNDLSIIDQVMDPIGVHFEKEKHKSESRKYRRYYEAEEINQSVNRHFPDEMIQAMQAEFSATVDDMRAIRDCLQNHAIEIKSDILRLKRSELKQLLMKSDLVNDDVVEPVINYFTLLPRGRWDMAPDGYTDRDWQPWKFRRRLSVLWKPLVQLNMHDDPDIMISVDMYTEAFGYFFSNIHDGTFDAQWFNSRPMKRWLGKIRDEEGDRFEDAVEERVGSLGLEKRRGITLNEITQSDMAGVDYGDIDVLCWNNASGDVFVIECKNFDLAKTYSETCERLSKMRGELKANDKPDDLLKHLNRVEQVTLHIDDVRKLTGIENPKIRSVVVFNRPAPMCYHKPDTEIETDFLALADLDVHLGSS